MAYPLFVLLHHSQTGPFAEDGAVCRTSGTGSWMYLKSLSFSADDDRPMEYEDLRRTYPCYLSMTELSL